MPILHGQRITKIGYISSRTYWRDYNDFLPKWSLELGYNEIINHIMVYYSKFDYKSEKEIFPLSSRFMMKCGNCNTTLAINAP